MPPIIVTLLTLIPACIPLFFRGFDPAKVQARRPLQGRARQAGCRRVLLCGDAILLVMGRLNGMR